MKKVFDKKVIWVLAFLVIFIIGIIYRLMFMNIALWYDEACSWAGAVNNFPFGIMEYLLKTDLQHTPLYFILLHFWMKIFGESEFAIRFLSLIFSLMSLPLVYVITNKLSSKIIAIFTTFVAAVSPVLVLFSVEARMYPVVLFFVLLSFNYVVDVYNGNVKSCTKLLISNLLIPYTLVGGIFYNISLLIFGLPYLYKNKKDVFKTYSRFVVYEWILLIPYFVMVIYYAIQRYHFVIRHEGKFLFVQFVDLIRNLFSVTTVPNLYWPDAVPIVPNAKFFFFAFLPCMYFIYGFFRGFNKSEGFLKVLYKIVALNFTLFLVSSALQINVCTIRYIIYLLPLIFILSIIGLSKKLSKIHFVAFILYFVISSMYFNVGFAKLEARIKENAFKAIRIEADRIGLNSDDVIIMPFGSDAPYYFKEEDSPRVFNFDTHKELRNPHNSKVYDKFQQKFMDKETKYNMIYYRMQAEEPFSQNFAGYFVNSVNVNVPKDRFVLIALLASDADSLISVEELKQQADSVKSVKDDVLSLMFAKHMCDIRYLLALDFDFMGKNVVNNYTFLLYKKR